MGPFSFVGENTGFLPQKGQAEASLTRGPGSTLLLSCTEHPVLISPWFPPLGTSLSSWQAAQRIQTPTGLSALWSGATRRCRHCSSENNAAARFVPVISNLLRTVNNSQASSAYWRITKHSGVPPLTLLQRGICDSGTYSGTHGQRMALMDCKDLCLPKRWGKFHLGPPLTCAVLLVFWLEAI